MQIYICICNCFQYAIQCLKRFRTTNVLPKRKNSNIHHQSKHLMHTCRYGKRTLPCAAHKYWQLCKIEWIVQVGVKNEPYQRGQMAMDLPMEGQREGRTTRWTDVHALFNTCWPTITANFEFICNRITHTSVYTYWCNGCSRVSRASPGRYYYALRSAFCVTRLINPFFSVVAQGYCHVFRCCSGGGGLPSTVISGWP